MKRVLLLCFITLFIIVACTNSSENIPKNSPPDAIGLIYELDMENQRILVVSDIDNVDIPYEEWFENGKFAAFFKVTEDTIIKHDNLVKDFSALKKGQKVELWHTGVLAESYPMQGEATYIKIID